MVRWWAFFLFCTSFFLYDMCFLFHTPRLPHPRRLPPHTGVRRYEISVTKTQEVILSAFGMDWNHVKYCAEHIRKVLKGVQ